VDYDSTYIDYTLVRGWLDICDHWHSCNSSERNRHLEYPLMKGDLLLIDCKDGCLVTGPNNDSKRDFKFVALSYVWGNIPIFKTSTSNLPFLKRPGSVLATNPTALIPQTIRDAMTFVLKLQLRYLWVDSLCIVQDDPGILERNLDAMAIIYRKAYLTIIDALGTDAFHGLLGVQTSRKGDSITVKYGAGSFILFRHRLKDISSSPWASRGWTLQEALFSTRRLEIGQRVTWRCLDCVVSEGEDKPEKILQNMSKPHIVQWKHIGSIETYSWRLCGTACSPPAWPDLHTWSRMVTGFRRAISVWPSRILL
jgi:Heterokaryon incompatibility protein (HET)